MVFRAEKFRRSKGYFFRIAVVICLLFCLGQAAGAEAVVLDVPRQYKTVQDAVRAAGDGNIILVAPGRYLLYFDNLTIINKELTLKSSHGAAQTTIVGKSGCPVITFAGRSRAVLDGFTIISQEISGRVAGNGGGIYCKPGTAPVITNNVITGNTAVFGAGIFCDTQSSPLIGANLISGNRALASGGGIYSFRSSAKILKNRLQGNEAENSGGAIACNRDCSRLTRNIIWQNRARFGGAISCDRAATIIDNITAVANQADYGGGIMVDRGSVRLTNLILWQNSDGDLRLKETGLAARPVYSDIQDGSFRGTNGNIALDPLFVDAQNGDFHLQPASPCRDKGMFDPFYMDEDGSVNDMGAYGGQGVSADKSIAESNR